MAINYKLKKRYKKKFDNVLLLDLIESKTYLGEPKFSWDPDIKHHLTLASATISASAAASKTISSF